MGRRVADKPLTCLDCGRVFVGYPSRKYCDSCRIDRVRAADKKRRRHGPQRPIGSKDLCQVCGEEYTVMGGVQKYCPACADTAYKAVDRAGGLRYYRANKDAINPARNEARHKTYTCAWCGKEFPAAGTRRNTCSPECKRLAYNRRQREYMARRKTK